MEKTFELMIENRPKVIQSTANKLREIILNSLDDIEENIYGGKKVQNALYSKKGNTQKVVCGIQTNDNYCIFYLHKTDQVDTNAFKLEGSGKHAKHVKFQSLHEVEPQSIQKVLTQIYEIT